MLAAFLALQSVIVAAWWRWLTPRSAGWSVAERLMSAGVLAVAQIVGVSLLLGWCGLLAPRPLVLLVAAVSVALLMSPLPRATAAAAEVAPPARSIWIARANLALAAIVLPTIGVILVRGVLAPDFGWDGMRYHLPISALMLQTGGFAFPRAHNSVINGYPKVAEIWTAWVLAFFGDDRWVGLAQLPFLALAMLATYAGARRLAVSRAAALTGALLWPCVPVVLSQISVAYIDLVLASLLLSAVALILSARVVAPSALPAALGSALGLLLGAKFTALLFVPVLYVVFAVVGLRVHGRRLLPGLAFAALLILFFGSDTYVRNVRQYGNPVYPYRAEVLGHHLPGPLSAMSVYGVAETRDVPPVVSHFRSWSAVDVIAASSLYGGFGAAAPFLAAVFAVALATALRRRDWPWLLLFALFALLLYLTPIGFRLRFVLYLLGLGGICLGRLVDGATPWARTAWLAALVIVAVVSCAQLLAVELPLLRAVDGTRADTCRNAPTVLFRPAYLWLREHAPAGSTVLSFPPPPGPFDYCLWTPTFSNRLVYAIAPNTAELERLAVTQPDALFFLPNENAVHAAFVASDPARWRTLFADPAVTIVSPAPATNP